jgi:hypothetical protein
MFPHFGNKKAWAYTYFFNNNNKKLQEKKKLLASFAFVHARLLPKVLIALALATLERPSEIASDKFMSRSPLSLSGVGS